MTLDALCGKGSVACRVTYDAGEYWKGDVVLKRRVSLCLRQDWQRCPYAKRLMAVLPDVSEYVIGCQLEAKGSRYWVRT
jgi:hypothetical protein